MLVVFVHGWSVTNTDTYGGLPSALARNSQPGLDITVQHLYLAKYISFSDEVSIDDIARRMQNAVVTEVLPKLRRGERFECAGAGVWFAEVDEAFSTQTCSVCKSRAGPKGRKDLGIRGWQCTVCGAIHDRNDNAADNILAAGIAVLQKESSSLEGEEDVKIAAVHRHGWPLPDHCGRRARSGD